MSSGTRSDTTRRRGRGVLWCGRCMLMLVGLVSLSAGCSSRQVATRAELIEEHRLDEQLKRLCDGLHDSLSRQAEQGILTRGLRYIGIGIVPFEEHGPRTRVRQLGRLVADALSVCLVRDHGLDLIEHLRKADVHTVALASDFDSDSARGAWLGREAGAEVVVLGSVSDDGRSTMMIQVRAVRTHDDRSVAAMAVEVPADPLVDRAIHLFDRKSKWGAVRRSLLLPGWGQAYNDEPVKSASIAIAQAALVGAAVGYRIAGYAAEQRYAVDRRDTVPDRAQAMEHYERSTALLITAGAVHLASLVDAWINGYTYTPDLLTPRLGITPGQLTVEWRF